MLEDEFQALKEDIKKHGLIERIVTLDGQILDGRHRFRACTELGINPSFELFHGKDPIAFVVSKNQHRRHLTSSQKAVIGASILKEYSIAAEKRMKSGQNQHSSPSQIIDKGEKGRAADKVAKDLGTNRQYVYDAEKLIDESPALAEQVRQGTKTIPQAKAEIKKQEKQERIEITKQGMTEKANLYEDETISFFHADCTQYLRTLPDNSVDLIVIDPPYFQVVSNEWDNQWDSLDAYLQWCEAWMIESLRVLKTTGSFYIWGGVGEFTSHIIHQKLLLDRLGFHFKDWLTWKKARGMGHRRGWLYTREECLWYVKDNDLFVWNEDAQYSEEPNQFKVGMGGHALKSEFKRLSNVWTDIAEPLGAKTTLHYTPKPIGAIKRIIAAHTAPNDLVLDFFSGSGTTGLAALELGRRAFLVDSDEQSFIEGKARVQDAKIK
jgi:DNA modification methylase